MQQIIYNGITIICAVYLAFVYVAYLNITLDKSNKRENHYGCVESYWLLFITLVVGELFQHLNYYTCHLFISYCVIFFLMERKRL